MSKVFETLTREGSLTGIASIAPGVRVRLDPELQSKYRIRLAPDEVDLSGGFIVAGRIAHLAVWDKALTDAEVLTLSNGFSPLGIQRNNLIAYWPLNGQGPEPDIIGKKNLTIVGAPTVVNEPPIPKTLIAP
jgi:hypothetical protein